MRGEFFVSHGAFTTKAAPVQWAEGFRKDMESETWMEPLPPFPLP